MKQQSYVYIMANIRPTLYIGVTSDLIGRVYMHRNEMYEGFTSKYGITKLVYFEAADSIEAATLREKQLKRWNRDWKLRLITEKNPELDDLFPQLVDNQIDSRLRGNDVVDFDRADVKNDIGVLEATINREQEQ